jgi:hypothetical protein
LEGVAVIHQSFLCECGPDRWYCRNSEEVERTAYSHFVDSGRIDHDHPMTVGVMLPGWVGSVRVGEWREEDFFEAVVEKITGFDLPLISYSDPKVVWEVRRRLLHHYSNRRQAFAIWQPCGSGMKDPLLHVRLAAKPGSKADRVFAVHRFPEFYVKEVM